MPVPMTMVEVPTKAEHDDAVAALNDRIDTLVAVIAERDARYVALEARVSGIAIPEPVPPPDLTEINRKLNNQGGRIRDLEDWRKTVPDPAAPSRAARNR